jgi:type IV secretory pathway protease TraF
MTGRTTTLFVMLGPAALALSTVAAKPAKRYIWNASASVPVGLYRLRPTGSLWLTNSPEQNRPLAIRERE